MAENAKIEEQKDSSIKFSLTICSEKVEKLYNSLIERHRKSMTIKGFRKGKAPLSLIKAQLGKSPLTEATEEAIEESLREFFKEIKRFPVGGVDIDGGFPQWSPGKDLSLQISCDLFPEVPLGVYLGIPITERPVEVSQKDEELALEQIRKERATFSKKSQVGEGDVVSLDYEELDASGEALPESARKGVTLIVGETPFPYPIEKELLGLETAQTKETQLTLPEDFADPSKAGKQISLRMKVLSIKERCLPPLDDELAKKINDQWSSLDDLRRDVSEKLSKAAARETQAANRERLMEQLIERTPISLPETMVKEALERRWKHFSEQMGTSEEQLLRLLKKEEKTKESLFALWRFGEERHLKGELVLSAIAKKERITVSTEEVIQEARERLNMPQLEPENLEKFLKEEVIEHFVAVLEKRKLFDLLLNKATITIGDPIALSDLQEYNGSAQGGAR